MNPHKTTPADSASGHIRGAMLFRDRVVAAPRCALLPVLPPKIKARCHMPSRRHLRATVECDRVRTPTAASTRDILRRRVPDVQAPTPSTPPATLHAPRLNKAPPELAAPVGS